MTKGKIVQFWGGPEDGAERRLSIPLSETIEINGPPFDEKDEQGVKVATGRKVHIYVYSPETNRYRYQGDRVEREEVE